MTPGALFFDRYFQFHDGEEGQKILVALGTVHGVTVVVRTTSQGRRYRNDFGCQADHRFPNFHLVKGCCCAGVRVHNGMAELKKDADDSGGPVCKPARTPALPGDKPAPHTFNCPLHCYIIFRFTCTLYSPILAEYSFTG